MRQGMDPGEATKDAIQRIVKMYPDFIGAIIAIDKLGNHGMQYRIGGIGGYLIVLLIEYRDILTKNRSFHDYLIKNS